MTPAPRQLEFPQPAKDLSQFVNEVLRLTTLPLGAGLMTAGFNGEMTADGVRAAILVPGHEFDRVIYRRKEDFAAAFQRIFGEPLKLKRKGK